MKVKVKVGIFVSILILLSVSVVHSSSVECLTQATRTSSSDGKVPFEYPTPTNNALEMGPYLVLNNVWGMIGKLSNFTSTIFICENGYSWGYSWERYGVGATNWAPNYPESIYGAGPYSTTPSSSKDLPLKLSQIDTILGYHDVSIQIDDNYGKNMWDFSYDLFLTSAEPGTGVSVAANITDEVMIWFGWNAQSNPTPVQANAVNDGYNTYDYTVYSPPSTPGINWRYHQFRITGGIRVPPVVSVKPFFDYIQKKFSIPDIWFGSMQIGSEYWDDTTGYVIYNNLTYVITHN